MDIDEAIEWLKNADHTLMTQIIDQHLLTMREQEIWLLLREGSRTSKIAEWLMLSEKTICLYVVKLYHKLHHLK